MAYNPDPSSFTSEPDVPNGPPASAPQRRPIWPYDEEHLPPSPEPPPPSPPRRPRVEIPTSLPVFTYVLLGINILVFLIDQGLMGEHLTYLGRKDNFAILQGEYWRLLTPIFLHVRPLALPIHLLMNSYALYIIGPQVERAFGYTRFLALYFLSGIAGNIASFGMSPTPAVGASGAIFGLIGALLPLLYLNRDVIANTRARIISILQVIVLNLIIGFTLSNTIDNWGHIGGLLGGLALAALITPRYTVQRDDLDGTIRVNDETSPGMTWVAISAIGALMGIVFAAFLIYRS